MNILENLIYPAMNEIRETLENPEQFEESPKTVLLGTETALDSFGLVSFINVLEEQIEDKLDVSLTLANEKAFSRKNSPFQTIETLAEYIKELLTKNKIEFE